MNATSNSSLDTKVKLAPAPAQCLSNDLLPFKTISMLQDDEEVSFFNLMKLYFQ